jgi:hypothetical protein
MASSPFGLVTNLAVNPDLTPAQRDDALDLVQQTGAGCIREEIRWVDVQTVPGEFHWEKFDAVINGAVGRGIEVLGLLAYNNVFITSSGKRSCDPPDVGPWQAYVTAVVDRYKDRIHAWEAWNEPDVMQPDGPGGPPTHFWLGTVPQYVDLLTRTHDIIKNLDNGATVLSGGCSNMNLDFFTQMLQQGGANAADVFALHPYVDTASLNGGAFQDTVLQQMQAIQSDFRKPIWFTEFGWSTAPTDRGFACVGTEHAQANFIVRQYVELLHATGLNVERAFLYTLRNGGTDGTASEDNYGLTRSDLSQKEAFAAYRQLTARLVSVTPQGRIATGAGTAYRFDRFGTTVDVLWGAGLARLPTTASVAFAFDALGHALPADVSGGQIHVTLVGDPVYVEHQQQ